MQTAETALLFLQLIMRKLKRPGQGSEDGGRAAVVVPNGTLFADGIAAHERVHGKMIVAMTANIIAATVGLRMEDDPKCRRIRAEVLARVKQAYADYQDESAAFDRSEMANGGTIHRLILGLVNG